MYINTCYDNSVLRPLVLFFLQKTILAIAHDFRPSTVKTLRHARLAEEKPRAGVRFAHGQQLQRCFQKCFIVKPTLEYTMSLI